MKVVIVGGVAGGASAATRARRLSEQAEIVLLERGPDVSFANCGLPYYVGQEIVERGKLLVTTPARLRARFRLDVRTQTEAVAIDRAAHTVRLRNVATGAESVETYDRLILAPGAAPIRPPLPGLDLPGIHTLRNLADVDRIKSAVDGLLASAPAGTPPRAIIVGAGFIGLELVENLVRRGVQCTVVELQDQVLPPFDREMTTPIAEALARHGVDVRLQEAAEGFEAVPGGVRIRLKSGTTLDGQVVILGVGVRPENRLAVEAGLEVGPRGGIRVNESLQTSDPHIYAVGDAIEVRDPVTGAATQVPLAGPANRQGRLAANHIFGQPAHYRGTQGTAIVRVFDRVAACTGAAEKTLQRAKLAYRKVYIHPMNHAGYYPGAEQMTLKLLFDPQTGRILGAQGVGGDGVDKRIDVLAIALQAGLTVTQLEEAELCYSPQFGSAKDPVNMLGFVASGLLRGEHPQLDLDAVLALPEAQRPLLLDVRTVEEFSQGTLPGAVNIPVDDLRTRLGELPRDRPIAAFCQVGQRGYLATRILLQHGFDVWNIGGGYKTYRLFVPAQPGPAM
jgi:NADPH-dependent 2,4-dienoyl-CoA reductase/sulfur reductase-like enzyme/rhodanese-related sulfurtransferase